MAGLPEEARHSDLDSGWLLPEPAEREAIHTRSIVCRGFRRADGLIDIDGRFVDTRPFAYESSHRGKTEPGKALHHMQLRLTVDGGRKIMALSSAMPASPFPTCPDISPNFQRLVGLSIGRGFKKALREALGGIEGCTHVTALLEAMAASAAQTFSSNIHAPARPGLPVPVRIWSLDALVDSCHSYRGDGPIVARMRSR